MQSDLDKIKWHLGQLDPEELLKVHDLIVGEFDERAVRLGRQLASEEDRVERTRKEMDALASLCIEGARKR